MGDSALRPDVALIGTSPLMLVRALGLQRQGRSVVLIERSQHVGGSWYTPSVLGFDNVEVGVHLLENRPRVYAFLEERLAIPLRSSGSEDFGLVRGRRLPMPATRVALHTLVGTKALIKGRQDQRRRMLISARRALRNAREPTRYPVRGCSEITNRLIDLLRSGGADFRFGHDVSSIEVDLHAGVARCQLPAGEIVTDRIVIGSRAHAPLRVGQRRLELSASTTESWTAVVHLRATKRERFGYVEVIGDPLVRRVRDVGQFSQPVPAAGQVLLAVQLRQPPAELGGSDRIAACAIERLVELGLLDLNVECLGVHLDTYELVTIDDLEMIRIERELSPVVLPLLTTDFAEGLVTLLAAV